jgi:hypothetical protein
MVSWEKIRKKIQNNPLCSTTYIENIFIYFSVQSDILFVSYNKAKAGF